MWYAVGTASQRASWQKETGQRVEGVNMAPQKVLSRLDSLERRVDGLESLPGQVARLELQFLQFRDEVHDELSAVRAEMRTLGNDLRAEMKTLGDDLRADISEVDNALRGEMTSLEGRLRMEIRAVDEDLRREMAALEGRLRTEIQAGDEETRHLMRILHEDVISRLTLIQNGAGTKGSAKRAPKQRGRKH